MILKNFSITHALRTVKSHVNDTMWICLWAYCMGLLWSTSNTVVHICVTPVLLLSMIMIVLDILSIGETNE